MWTAIRTVPSAESRVPSQSESSILLDPRPGTRDAGLVKGDRVRHSVFGIGQVLEMTGSGDKARVRVNFQGWGEKNLALEFARLEKL